MRTTWIRLAAATAISASSCWIIRDLWRFQSSIAEHFDSSGAAIVQTEKSTSLDDSTWEADHALQESCDFGDANGHFEEDWKWVADRNGANCTIEDYLSPLLANQWRPADLPITLLFIGDSLSRKTVEHICEQGQTFSYLPFLDSKDLALVNRAEDYPKKSHKICTDGKVFFAFFSIYGMHHECDNTPALFEQESRHYPTSAQRIEQLLPVDILWRLPQNSTFKVLVNSALWDLSIGCNNNPGVSDTYQIMYQNGTKMVHEALRKVLPQSTEYFWRTGPRISQRLDQRNPKPHKHQGKSRANQDVLNNILRQTVWSNNLGVVIDWDKQLSNLPEKIIAQQAYDGIHYKAETCLALVNLWMNAIFENKRR